MHCSSSFSFSSAFDIDLIMRLLSVSKTVFFIYTKLNGKRFYLESILGIKPVVSNKNRIEELD